jgi:uracil-DNA glycosylase
MSGRRELGSQILEHLKLYNDLGVRWVRRQESDNAAMCAKAVKNTTTATRVKKTAAASEPARSATSAATADETFEAIRADLQNCKRCKLAEGRKNIVFGSGNQNAELMFVGEAPGAEEDEQGLPFVGRAGQLLTKIIESIGMRRDEVFICNILKCRPPGNRNPETDEIAACERFLFRQIAAVKPKIICALGTFGAQTLLKTTEPIGKLRGKIIDYRGVKVIATFHPAYLLRNPNEKRRVWEDMKIIRRYISSLNE